MSTPNRCLTATPLKPSSGRLAIASPAEAWSPTFTLSAAMALAYDSRRSTRDIDAVFELHGIVLDEARAVARELGLPQWWLNEQASVYVASGGDPAAKRVFDHPGLRVSAASAKHLLAMKVLAARRRDAEDIRTLTHHLRITSVEDTLALCAEVFPEEPVPDRALLVLEDVFDADQGLP